MAQDKPLRAAAARLDEGQLVRWILAPSAAMPKIFPEHRTAEDERDIRDIVRYLEAGLD